MNRYLLVSALGTHLLFCAYGGTRKAQITFRVTDDAGNAVVGAVVKIKTFERWKPGPEFGKDIYRFEEGRTDTNGVITLQIDSRDGSVKYWVHGHTEYFDNITKMWVGGVAYYRDRGGIYQFTNVVGRQWEPWNPLVEIELKPVLNPIPMCAKSFINSWPQLQVPELGKPCGFDLMKGDWVVPHGKGETADLYFTLSVTNYGERKVDRIPLFDAVLSVTFGNEGDGIQGFFARPFEGSVFRSPRFAPESGYSNSLVKVCYQHETEGRIDKREDQNYFFRVRTQKDEHGNIVSALYGKIYGDIDFNHRGELLFLYYLNPTPNDRNMEFDPKRNLFTDLKPQERVYEP